MKRLVLALLILPVAGEAQAFDCSKAATKVEAAICGDAALKAADDAMSAAYGDLRALSSPAERKGLAISQKTWLAERERDCVEAGKPNAACIRERTDERRRRLLAQPKSGPGAPSRLMAVFVQRAGTRKLPGVDYQLVRFAKPKSAGETRFNREVEKIAKDLPGPNDEESPEDITYAMEATMDVDYASPRLISAGTLVYSYLGGAHPNTFFASINVDLKSGKLLTYGDVFEPAALVPITAECRKQIIAEKTERSDGEAYDPALDPALKDETIRDQILAMEHWSFTAAQGTVTFNAYDIGAYAEGTFACDFPLATLRNHAKPGAPLPQ